MNKSVYIHIPFCNTICSYCDFCKLIYKEEWVDKYLNALEKEIKLNYKNEKIKTLYIGGGTPSSLNINQLEKLNKIINLLNLNNLEEFTFECNIESITEEKLKYLKKMNVTRLSIGIETFNDKFLKFLNRNHTNKEIKEKINMAKQLGFNNINIDLIYALENQTLEDLKYDLIEFLKLDVEHISTYSLIIEPNTKLYIDKKQNINEELDRKMYDLICNTLKENNYKHYEISNFAKPTYESKHNLTYWNNEEYYGFGLGASGYINNIRYENTKNLTKYLKGDFIKEKRYIELNEKIENEFMLGFRKIDGINKKEFQRKYKFDLKKYKQINKLLNNKKLIEDKKYIKINSNYIYTENEILVDLIDEDYLSQMEVNNG